MVLMINLLNSLRDTVSFTVKPDEQTNKGQTGTESDFLVSVYSALTSTAWDNICFASLPFTTLLVCPRLRLSVLTRATHAGKRSCRITHTQTHTDTLVLISKWTAVSCWLPLLSGSVEMFSLTLGHLIIVKHTDVEQQTHVLDGSLGNTLKSHRQIFPHSELEEKKVQNCEVFSPSLQSFSDMNSGEYLNNWVRTFLTCFCSQHIDTGIGPYHQKLSWPLVCVWQYVSGVLTKDLKGEPSEKVLRLSLG